MTLSATPEARRRAGARWQALKERLQSVSPQALARGLIAAGVIGLGLSLSVATWPTLLPFVAGAILAYSVLPIANRLDRFMPRVLAAILAELVAVGILVRRAPHRPRGGRRPPGEAGTGLAAERPVAHQSATRR